MSWISWALLSAVFAALTAIFAKVGVARIDSDLATFVRTAVVLVLLGPFVFLSGKWSNPLDLPPRALGFLVLSALATGASWVCYFRALQLGPVAQVASLDKLSVVLVALFAVVFLGERPSALGWLGIALVGTGAAVIAFAASRGSA
ncbi:MAG TPA: EamA family transporter [Luteimonas sp.]|nr:EamA family transporter [Luteimonas sp.]HRP72089.1 EamA family transporter [Luteimonas sp.]